MIARTTASVVGMAVIAAASFLYMDRLGLHMTAFEHVRTASMSVTDTNGLVVGSRVLIRGVAVGHVTGITAAADHIEVNWNYNSDYRIPVDSRFRVDNLSALGEAYLAIAPATTSGPFLADEASVPSEKVVVPTTFKELSARLTRLLEQVDPQRIQDIFHTMDIALPDDTRVVGDLNHAGELLASALTSQSDNLTTLLRAIQPLLLQSSSVPGDLAATTPIVADFGGQFSGILDSIHFATEFGPLRDGIKYGAGPLIGQLQQFLDKSSGDLQVLGVDLLPGVRAGAAALQTVDVGRFLDNALAATETGDALTIHVHTPGR
ncbi:MCE family protein [Nocardia sp. ET3-3]|uniref:MCE family protein n=1 Tax=Nocardia terrae TaxID=2675851 RepID=A0A7K1V294_9NOCA|nr:MlaD family protein [Nocardia terrae]MVU80725.1 MCE family protein [Nocardia terrae]